MEHDAHMPMPEDSPARAADVERLVAEITPRLYRYALVRLGRVDLAEDAVGETLCRLIEKGPGLSPGVEVAHVRGWCVRCMVNVCREFQRRPRTLPLERAADAAAAHEPTHTYRFADWHEAMTHDSALLIGAVGRLSDRQQEAIILRVLMGLPVQAVAQAMNCAEGTVKALTHQGIATLREGVANRTQIES